MKKNINHVVAKNNRTSSKKSHEKNGDGSLFDEKNPLHDGHESVGADFDAFLHTVAQEKRKKTVARSKLANKKNKLAADGDGSSVDDHLHVGSDFDLFLQQQEMAQEVNLAAIKKIISYEIQREMAQKKVTQTAMADRLGTSRAGLKRLLDPDNYSITLHTLNKVAYILSKRLEIVFHDL
ncbi:MAG: helix-turn-helix transcriptional regulator [Candidatus Babeliales bacterium]|nr:helix-turn-helix transcriptional regulator [Candidatus Babeliales bacterium]